MTKSEWIFIRCKRRYRNSSYHKQTIWIFEFFQSIFQDFIIYMCSSLVLMNIHYSFRFRPRGYHQSNQGPYEFWSLHLIWNMGHSIGICISQNPYLQLLRVWMTNRPQSASDSAKSSALPIFAYSSTKCHCTIGQSLPIVMIYLLTDTFWIMKKRSLHVKKVRQRPTSTFVQYQLKTRRLNFWQKYWLNCHWWRDFFLSLSKWRC